MDYITQYCKWRVTNATFVIYTVFVNGYPWPNFAIWLAFLILIVSMVMLAKWTAHIGSAVDGGKWMFVSSVEVEIFGRIKKRIAEPEQRGVS